MAAVDVLLAGNVETAEVAAAAAAAEIGQGGRPGLWLFCPEEGPSAEGESCSSPSSSSSPKGIRIAVSLKMRPVASVLTLRPMSLSVAVDSGTTGTSAVCGSRPDTGPRSGTLRGRPLPRFGGGGLRARHHCAPCPHHRYCRRTLTWLLCLHAGLPGISPIVGGRPRSDAAAAAAAGGTTTCLSSSAHTCVVVVVVPRGRPAGAHEDLLERAGTVPPYLAVVKLDPAYAKGAGGQSMWGRVTADRGRRSP